MDKAKLLILIGQIAVLVVLGVLVGLDHDGPIQDGLLAVAGSIAGIGLYDTIAARAKN